MSTIRKSLTVTPRDPQTDPPPCDGTQVVWGYRDGEILAGDAHYMWNVYDHSDEDPWIDPDIVWWFNAQDLVDGSV